MQLLQCPSEGAILLLVSTNIVTTRLISEHWGKFLNIINEVHFAFTTYRI